MSAAPTAAVDVAAIPPPPAESKASIYAAAAANLAIAAAKGGAFFFTGSSAMLTEAIHSLVDTGNEALLLLGLRRGKKAANAAHPFGYGMEVYFWSFIVALMIFALGGAVSVWEGVWKLRHPEPIHHAWVNFLVIGLAIVFEGASLLVAWRQFKAGYGKRGVLRSIRRSKDPSLFTVLLEDSAALGGLLLAGLGVAGSALLGLLWADAVASIGIGVLLVLVATVLAVETRSLLTGEAASDPVLARVRKAIDEEPAVLATREVKSLHLGPRTILMAVTLDFSDDLPCGALKVIVERLTARIRAADPRISDVFLRPG